MSIYRSVEHNSIPVVIDICTLFFLVSRSHQGDMPPAKPISRKGEGFPGSSAGKESTFNAGDPGSIPESEGSPGEATDHQQ